MPRLLFHPSWGWLVVVGASVSNFVSIGTIKSFGVLLPHLVESLKTSTSIIGLAVGFSHGLAVGFAIVTNQLLKKMSARKLVMFGGFLAGSGYCACACVNTIDQFIAGTITSGLGLGLVVLSLRVTIVEYFPTNYSLATSAMLAGGGIGMMILPPVTEYLLDVYGLRGALLLLGGCNFHTMVSGVIVRPIIEKNRHGANPLMPNPSIDLEKDVRRLKDNGDADETVSTESTGAKDNQGKKEEKDVESTKDSRYGHVRMDKRQQFRDVSRTLQSRLDKLVRLLELDIFLEYPHLILIICAVFLHGITCTSWLLFLVPNAITKGHSPQKAVFLSTIGGAFTVVGRLSIGIFLYIAERYVTTTDAFAGVSALSAIAFFFNPEAHLFLVLASAAVVNGVTNGAKTVLITVASRSSVSADRFPTALSFAMFALGVSQLLGGFITGWIYDATLSYDQAFLVLGGLDSLGFVCIITTRCFTCRGKTISSHRKD